MYVWAPDSGDKQYIQMHDWWYDIHVVLQFWLDHMTLFISSKELSTIHLYTALFNMYFTYYKGICDKVGNSYLKVHTITLQWNNYLKVLKVKCQLRQVSCIGSHLSWLLLIQYHYYVLILLAMYTGTRDIHVFTLGFLCL